MILQDRLVVLNGPKVIELGAPAFMRVANPARPLLAESLILKVSMMTRLSLDLEDDGPQFDFTARIIDPTLFDRKVIMNGMYNVEKRTGVVDRYLISDVPKLAAA